MVRVYFLGNILCRGERGAGGEVTGRVVKAHSAAEASAKLMLTGDEILVTGNLEASYLPLVRNIAGYVIEGYSDLSWAQIEKENPDCVGVASAAGIFDLVQDNMVITISGREKMVYEGVF